MREFWEELNILPDYSCNTDGRVSGTLVEINLMIAEASHTNNYSDIWNHITQ